MNEEVKEIIDYFRNYVNDKYSTYTVVDRETRYLKTILDYITSLEQKLETEHKAYMGTVQELTETATEKERLEKENKYLSDKVIKYTEVVDQQASKLKSIEQTINDINKSDINENNLLTFLNEIERIVKENKYEK